MSHANCPNCNAPLHGEFCCCCGQSATTHRITTKHFLFHDILHGVWHIEKGMLFTLKEVFTRPGYAAKDYISGKRIRYYNVFYLIVLLLGIMLVFSGDSLNTVAEEKNTAAHQVLKMVLANMKFTVLTFLPLSALNSFILFRRLHYNYAEHLIIAGFTFVGFCFLGIFGEIFYGRSHYVTDWISTLFDYLAVIFFLWSYYQATRSNYKALGFLWRMLVFMLLFLLEIIILFAIFWIILKL